MSIGALSGPCRCEERGTARQRLRRQTCSRLEGGGRFIPLPFASVMTSPLRKTAPCGTPRPPVGWPRWQVSWLAGR